MQVRSSKTVNSDQVFRLSGNVIRRSFLGFYCAGHVFVPCGKPRIYHVGGFFNQLKSTCIRHAVLEGLNVRTTWIPRSAPESMILYLNTHPTTEFSIPITQRNFE